MNIKSFINAFEETPDVTVAAKPTCPKDFDLHERIFPKPCHIDGCTHVFSFNNSISDIGIRRDGIVIFANSYHEESGYFTLGDLLDAYNSQISDADNVFHLTGLSLRPFKSKKSAIFKYHPELLSRNVKSIEYDDGVICVDLNADIDIIISL